MLNLLTSIARTGIPYLWGSLVTWLTARGLFENVLVVLDSPAWRGAVVAAVLTVVTTSVYALVRLVEDVLPDVLGKFLPPEIVGAVTKVVLVLLIGVPTQPEYNRPPVDELPVGEDQAPADE